MALDPKAVRKSFDHAAATYDAAAVLQREIGSRLLQRLEYIKLQPRRILDLGAGTGEFSLALQKRYKKADVVALDLSPAMLAQAKKRRGFWRRFQLLCANAQALPLADQSMDLIFSNASLQWIDDVQAVFAECRRVLKPGGALLFSTFGPDTLRELRASWASVDAHIHVHDFIDMHHIGDAMLAAGLKDAVTDMEMLTVTYHDVRDLLRDLKALGAHNAAGARRKTVSGKSKFKAMLQAYEQYRNQGTLPASYEVVYGHAWGVAQTRPGAVAIPVAGMRKIPRR